MNQVNVHCKQVLQSPQSMDPILDFCQSKLWANTDYSNFYRIHYIRSIFILKLSVAL